MMLLNHKSIFAPLKMLRSRSPQSRNARGRFLIGFTMIELLVMGGIIAILSAIVLPNYRGIDKQYALNLAANKLAQDIRSVREMAIASTECKACTPPNAVPPRYGIYTHESGHSAYYLFADLNNDGKFFWTNNPNLDRVVETLYYGSDIILDSITENGPCVPSGPMRGHVTFFPPDPATKIFIGKVDGVGDSSIECSDIAITLRAGSGGGASKSVIINGAGLIYVQ